MFGQVPRAFFPHSEVIRQSVLHTAHLVSILHLERWTVFGSGLAAVVGARGGNVGVAEPFLNLGDVGLVVDSVCGRCRALRMRAEAGGVIPSGAKQPSRKGWLRAGGKLTTW